MFPFTFAETSQPDLAILAVITGIVLVIFVVSAFNTFPSFLENFESKSIQDSTEVKEDSTETMTT